jgi:hypothetical protein
MLRIGNSGHSVNPNCVGPGWSNSFAPPFPHSAMTSHHPHPPPPVHFPTSGERGPFPFPTSASMAALHREGTGLPEELSEEELRLMADTMPGEGPGD